MKNLHEKLLEWDSKHAALDDFQLHLVLDMEKCLLGERIERNCRNDLMVSQTHQIEDPVETVQELLSIFNKIVTDDLMGHEALYDKYLDYLLKNQETCEVILKEIEFALNCTGSFSKNYSTVVSKSSPFHESCQRELQEQKQLIETSKTIKEYLTNFQLENVWQNLEIPGFLKSQEQCIDILTKIDNSIDFLEEYPNFKEAEYYKIKFKNCRMKAVQTIKQNFIEILTTTTNQVLSSTTPSQSTFTKFYGKFQSAALKTQKIVEHLEEKQSKCQEYRNLLIELKDCYLAQRVLLINEPFKTSIKELCGGNQKEDHCSLVRKLCNFLFRICQDELNLFYQFFGSSCVQLRLFLNEVCSNLSDSLLPVIIQINELETLTEICCILWNEKGRNLIFGRYDDDSSNPYEKIVDQLLKEVQERLVFRTQIYLQSDIRDYKPISGDLAYPEILKVAEDFAKNPTVGSTPDLSSMWYPPVKRTFICISRINRCFSSSPTFLQLSQEAIENCLINLAFAAKLITQQSPIDGTLFHIKYLMILRNQLACYPSSLIKEFELDFTPVLNVLHTPGNLLNMDSWMKENFKYSDKEIDSQLKSSCEEFITAATKYLLGSLMEFENYQPGKEVEITEDFIKEIEEIVKVKLPEIRRSLQLYLCNSDSEISLMKRVEQNVVNCVSKLKASKEEESPKINLSVHQV